MVIPPTMRQVVASGAGGPDVLHVAEGPVPQPGAGEVLVRVLAAGVNRPDVMQRRGLYPAPPGASPLLGLEVAGEIAQLGDGVEGWRVGDRVCALANGGGYAEWCTVPAGQCLPWPDGYEAVRAAALPETYFTVWANLFELGRLHAGETVLVHGGTSGIGTTAIQLAHERGARVYATAGSPEKVAACLHLGADGAVNYHAADFVESVRQWTDGRGVNVVLDMIGASYFARNLRCLALEGRLVLIAFQGGAKLDAGFDLTPIMTRRLHVTGSTMRPRTAAQKASIADALRREVWPVLSAGRAGPLIHETFPLSGAADAHRLMESGEHIGKIVLRVAD